MDQIENLREALRFSPQNIPLKLMLAGSLLKLSRYSEAETEYLEAMALDSANSAIKMGLSDLYFQQNDYSRSIVILEDILRNENTHFDALILYTKALVRENSVDAAIKSYQKALQVNPNFQDDELDRTLRVSNQNLASDDDDDDEDDFEKDANYLISKPNMDFDDVGGMEDVKREIEMKIIKPMQFPDLYKAYGKKAGSGILLYGPPGCGKTFIAKATAGQIKSNFISVGLNDILDMWVGNSEKNLHEVFEYARRNKPCVLFFDEIDALGASRNDMKHSGNKVLINQFLQELDGVDTDNDGILVLGATNAPWHLDTAFRRPGRFDRIIFVPPPDEEARETILKIKLRDKPIQQIDFRKLSKNLQDFSGADIEALIDIAVEDKLESAFRTGIPQPIENKDLAEASKKHKPTTREWFQTAKNFALYANESGLYDPILGYLKIKK